MKRAFEVKQKAFRIICKELSVAKKCLSVAKKTFGCAFKHIMSWSEFEIRQFFVIESRKQCINFNIGCVTNMAVIVVSSNEFSKLGLTNSTVYVIQKMLQWKIVKNSYELNSTSHLKGQQCGNETLESTITNSRKWTQSTKSWLKCLQMYGIPIP